MFSEDFLFCTGFTLRKDVEGGYYPGTGAWDRNPTKFGITLTTLIDANLDADGNGHIDIADIKGLTMAQALPIYHDRYYLSSRCEQLPRAVQVAHFDTAVNCGPTRAIVLLQRATGMREEDCDGVMGARTLAMVNRMPPYLLLNAQGWARLQYYSDVIRAQPVKAPALPHWLWRTLEIRKYVGMPQ